MSDITSIWTSGYHGFHDLPADRLLLSVVIPMHNESEGLDQLFERLLPILERISGSFEVVCVNDGSTDGTLAGLKGWIAREPRIRTLDLSRNFGKEAALTAGIDASRGLAVVPIDADLQDPPELIAEMVALWRQGNDVVLARRQTRDSDTRFKRVTARMFYKLFSRLSEVPVPTDVGDFRLMDRRVVEALSRLPERTRFMKGLFAWLGFRQATIGYVRPARAAGTTKWRVWKLWNFAIEAIVSFTTLPLRVWTYFGALCASAALLYLLWIIGKTLIFGIDVPGYASLMSVVLLLNGLVLFGLGVIGEYLGRVFIEVKRRPLYLVREELSAATAAKPESYPKSAGLFTRVEAVPAVHPAGE